jgi:hypothetical protein
MDYKQMILVNTQNGLRAEVYNNQLIDCSIPDEFIDYSVPELKLLRVDYEKHLKNLIHGDKEWAQTVDTIDGIPLRFRCIRFLKCDYCRKFCFLKSNSGRTCFYRCQTCRKNVCERCEDKKVDIHPKKRIEFEYTLGHCCDICKNSLHTEWYNDLEKDYDVCMDCYKENPCTVTGRMRLVQGKCRPFYSSIGFGSLLDWVPLYTDDSSTTDDIRRELFVNLNKKSALCGRFALAQIQHRWYDFEVLPESFKVEELKKYEKYPLPLREYIRDHRRLFYGMEK